MRPVTVLLLAMLLVSNLAWGLVVLSRRSAPATAAAPADAGEIGELREENARLRRQVEGSEKDGTSEPTKPASTSSGKGSRGRKIDPLAKAAWPVTQSWVADALQLSDPGKREAALAEIRRALTSDDPIRFLAALSALTSLEQLDFDKASFRSLVLPAFDSEHAAIRAAAVYALYATGLEPTDLDLILAMMDDPAPEVRSILSLALGLYSRGDFTGPAGPALMKLLESTDPKELTEVFRGLGGKLSPEITARLIEHARNPELRYNAIYFALSRVVKDEAVVEFLIEAAQDPSPQVRSQALWGLGWGVTAEAAPKVADMFLSILETRSDPQSWESAFRAIQQYGDQRHADRLARWAAGAGVPEATAKRAQEIEKQIRGRDRR